MPRHMEASPDGMAFWDANWKAWIPTGMAIQAGVSQYPVGNEMRVINTTAGIPSKTLGAYSTQNVLGAPQRASFSASSEDQVPNGQDDNPPIGTPDSSGNPNIVKNPQVSVADLTPEEIAKMALYPPGSAGNPYGFDISDAAKRARGITTPGDTTDKPGDNVVKPPETDTSDIVPSPEVLPTPQVTGADLGEGGTIVPPPHPTGSLVTSTTDGGGGKTISDPSPGEKAPPGLNMTGGLIDSRTGQYLSPYNIDRILLPQPGQISGTFDPAFQKQYLDLMNAIASQVQQQYQYQTPIATPAQMDTSAIPQPTAGQTPISPELQQMLSGQGFNPSILAGMRARATEDIAGAGNSEMGTARRALEQAGLFGSPAGAAVSADVARRSGNAQTAALRDIDIQNALQGIQNQQFGIGQQTSISLSNMAQANQMALANASRLFAGMGQNLSNQQQANLANFGARNLQLGTQAGKVSDFLASQGNTLNTSALNRNISADFTNVTNLSNLALNQAELDRQMALANQAAHNNARAQATAMFGGGGNLGNPNLFRYQGFNPFPGGNE